MNTLFGIPMGQIMIILVLLCLSIGTVLAILALRHRMLVALALRNIPRRRTQTWLIVLGLMLSTAVVSSSFATGDTMSYTARSLVADTLGRVDEVVVSFSRGRGARLGPNGLSGLSTSYFPEADYEKLRPKIKAIEGVTGVTGVIAEQASLVDRTSRQSKTAVTVLGLPVNYDLAFGRLVTLDETVASLGELGPDEVYLNREGADALGAAPGDELQLFFGYDTVTRHLKAVVHNGGPGGQQPVLLAPLMQLQQARGRDGQINQIEIANRGDELSGDRWSDAVMRQLRPLLIDDAAASDVLRSFQDPTVRTALEKALPRMRESARVKVGQLLAESNTDAPTPAFKALLGDREVLSAVGQVAFRLPDRAAGDRLLQSLRATAVMVGDDVKHQGLAAAGTAGSAITSIFVGLGLFSIASGTLLIFLIFVMLAAERRSEMGIARAIGTQRRHLIEMFLFEGALYDLAAALVGMVVGLGVGFGAVRFLSALLAAVDVRVYFHVETTSLAISFCLGLLLTFVTVGASAWRVSRLNIVAAIHNLPDSPRSPRQSRVRIQRFVAASRPGNRDFVWSVVLEQLVAVPVIALRSVVVGGPALALAGIALIALAGSRVPLLPVRALGTSLAIVGVALCLRTILSLFHSNVHIRDRLCFTVAGIALLGYWASPFNILQGVHSTDLQAGVELYFLAGLAMVAGGVWAVVYNADAVIIPLAGLLGRVFPVTAVTRTAAAYALRQRFRTGMALAMFALVIFTMVVASVLSTATRRAYGDVGVQEGGFDIRGDVPSYSDPIPDIHAALAAAPGVKPADFTAVGGLALMPGEAIDISGDVGVWRSTPLNAADDGFLAGTSLPLAVRARGYRDDRAVWRAIRTSPGIAVVDGNALASSPADLADRTAFTLARVFRGQATMEPETVWVRGQQGGKPIKLTVIGVLDPRATLAVGVTSSTVTFAQAMSIPSGRTFYFRVKPGLDVHQVAKGLGLSFVQSGMQTQVLADELQRIEGVRILLNELIQSYLGLGLVVGVAALGVISTRAVVERRQHIGMLRALGFQRGMVQISFLLETAFIAVGGTVLGVALGLQLARSLTGYIAQEHPEIVFSVPWAQLLFIGSVTCVASLVATWVPARRASRVLPAEALRYE